MSLKNFSFSWLLSLPTSVTLTVNPAVKYQKIIGFGGAITDAAGININSLGNNTKEKLIRSYFSVDGIEYNMFRVPIGGTDFSTHAYSYDDGPPDPDLKRFSLAEEDLKYKIPPIQWAVNISERELLLVSACWSPSPWMKSNNHYSGFSHLNKSCYGVYADYLLRFLDEYEKHGLKMWAISTGNEPSNGNIPVTGIDSLGWTPATLADWTANFFGPRLRSSVHNATLILTPDDQRFTMPWWIDAMGLANKESLQYIDGIALHWYWDKVIGPVVVSSAHDEHPDLLLLYTEACEGSDPLDDPVVLGSWDRGENYAYDIIQNLNSWVRGWMDWNLCLDLKGGPTYIGNYVDSSIIVNETADEFYKQPMFYAMGHFSKFIIPGAPRVDMTSTGYNIVQATAVENPDGTVVVIMLNKNNFPVNVVIDVLGKGRINLTLPPHSFATILC